MYVSANFANVARMSYIQVDTKILVAYSDDGWFRRTIIVYNAFAI